MANVRCPMCSKVNAPDAPVCAFCGARLKPLSAGESAPQTPASQPEDDAPDWLSGLRGSEPAAPSSGSEPSGAEANQDGDLPDWLARIRGRAQTESGGEAAATGFGDDAFSDAQPGGLEEAFGAQEDSQGGGLPDWLNQQPAGESQVPAADSTPSDDDWLTRLQDTGSSSFGSEPAQDFSSLSDFSSGRDLGENLDWLNQPSAEEPAQTTPSFDMGEPAKPPAADDWMSSFSSWSSDAAQESTQPPVEPAAPSDDLHGFGLTGFLSNFKGDEEQKPPEPPPAAETGSSGFGLTGFLSSLEGNPEQPLESEQQETSSSGLGLTGFFSTLESSDEQPSTAPSSGDDWSTPAASAAASSSVEGALPDWLSGAEPVQGRPEPEIPTGSTGDLSSWLSSLEGEQPQAQDAFDNADAFGDAGGFGAPAATEAPAEQIPDWLSAVEQERTSIAPQQAQPEESLPGWLSEAQPDAETSPAETANLGAEMPSWFADLQQPAAESAAGETAFADEAAFTAEAPAELPAASAMPGPFIDEDTPAWLRDFGAEGDAETSAEAAGISPLLESDLHPQMQSEAEQPFAVDLPDWLEEDVAQAGTAESTTETGASSQDLERVELPSWVAAMRPVESAMPGGESAQDTDQFIEKAGPLSGMRGVLPIPENLLRYRKPPIYSVKLHTTEKQRNQSALLDGIIAQESKPLLIPPARSHAPLLIMRIVIALVLVGVIALPNLMGMLGMPFDPLSMPALQPVELEEMYNQIDQSAQPGENYTVLLAFDYEPGFSGEMTAAASPVITHLMQQNAQIVVVSTSPNGPALANRLLEDVAGKSSYSVKNRSVNLGYLPGGTISLLEFVREPRFAAPATITGEPAWDETFLSGVNSIADFSQVIVLTDSAETGRSWIEQVSPQMGDVPLFMVASAQAAPMLIPYLNATEETNSGQIDGMVAGLMGGAQYGWFAGQQDTLTSKYWASYQLGIVLAIGLVLAGGLISGIRRMLARDEKGDA